MARYQVRGPHGATRDYARWTVVDTADGNITVDTARTRARAADVARELNAAGKAAELSPAAGAHSTDPDTLAPGSGR